MGAKPRWISLALTLPEASPDWLHGFSQGLFELANRYDVSLIGGDTTQGPLSISIQAMGEVPVGQAHRRDGSQPDDLVYVSGSLGDSKAGLDCYFANADQCSIDRSHRELLIARYLRPEPRVELGLALRGIATGCLDVSDGLIQDLQHICRASQLGAELSATALPLSAALRQYDLQYRQAEAESNPAGTVSNPGHTASYALAAALGGGDDYELCFTVPEHKVAELEAIAEKLALPLTAVGRVTKASEAGKVKVLDAAGREIALANTGYKHF
jgi:thiamine-monophosphate kinase